MAHITPVMEMTKRCGHTVYNVRAYCDPESKVTYQDTLLQLISSEANKQGNDNKERQTSEVSAC